jgi:hypothetical protein
MLLRELMVELERLLDLDVAATDDDLAGLPLLLDPHTSSTRPCTASTHPHRHTSQ